MDTHQKQDCIDWFDRRIKDKEGVGIMLIMGGKVYTSGCSHRQQGAVTSLLKAAQRTYDKVYKT